MINPLFPEEENKQEICDAVLLALWHTYNAGCVLDNPIKELKYISEKEVVRPIFVDGTGEDGSMDINVHMDSGTSMIVDIANQFIKEMW
jgi:hypothetical protein